MPIYENRVVEEVKETAERTNEIRIVIMERNEAIEIVREYYPSSGKDLNEALETLIPELKESEDEKIRKIIIKWATYMSAEWIKLYGVTKEEVLAWLEKHSSSQTKE